MHESSIENVKFFLDENEYISSEKYRLKGWVFHESSDHIVNKIQELRLVHTNRKDVYESTIEYPILRSDVGERYHNPVSSKSGFEILFRSHVEDKVILEVKIDNKWVLCETIMLMRGRLISDEPITKVRENLHPSIIAIDDFYEDPDAIRTMALSLDFKPSEYHKGKRTSTKYIVDGTREKIEQVLAKKIYNWSDQPHNGVFQYCTPADSIVYHYDSQQYAAVIFLTPNAPPEAGTSFFRHRRETWLDKDPSKYNTWHNAEELKRFDELIIGNEHDDFLDPSKWEVIDKIGNKYNRFAMWDASLIHAATSYFGKSKESGRLFHMFFFNAM